MKTLNFIDEAVEKMLEHHKITELLLVHCIEDLFDLRYLPTKFGDIQIVYNPFSPPESMFIIHAPKTPEVPFMKPEWLK